MERIIKSLIHSVTQLDLAIVSLSESNKLHGAVSDLPLLQAFYSYGDQLNSLAKIVDEISKHPENAVFDSILLKISLISKGYNFRERVLLILELLQYDSHSYQHTRMISLIDILEGKLASLEPMEKLGPISIQ